MKASKKIVGNLKKKFTQKYEKMKREYDSRCETWRYLDKGKDHKNKTDQLKRIVDTIDELDFELDQLINM